MAYTQSNANAVFASVVVLCTNRPLELETQTGLHIRGRLLLLFYLRESGEVNSSTQSNFMKSSLYYRGQSLNSQNM